MKDTAGEPNGNTSQKEAPQPGSYIHQLSDYYDDHAVTLLDQIIVNFSLRQDKTSQRLSTIESLNNYDQQINSALKYLAFHPETTKNLCIELLENAENECSSEAETFAAAVTALQSGDPSWIELVFNGFLPYQDYREGLVFALAWLPIATTAPWVKAFLASKNLHHKYLGVRVCSMLHQYPLSTIHALTLREDCQQDMLLYQALLFLIGQMKDTKLYQQLVQESTNEEPQIARTALVARLMQADKSAFGDAIQCSQLNSENFHQISPWLIRLMTIQESRNYLSITFKNDNITMDVKILALASHGDPSIISWMLQQELAPMLMPWVGLAFYQITGLDISQLQLGLTITDEDQLETIKDADKDTHYLDEDLSLPYPKRDKLLSIWQNMQSGLTEQTRYFLGYKLPPTSIMPIDDNACGFVRDNAAMYATLYDQKTHYPLFVVPQMQRG